jgi:hypothetical protein
LNKNPQAKTSFVNNRGAGRLYGPFSDSSTGGTSLRGQTRDLPIKFAGTLPASILYAILRRMPNHSQSVRGPEQFFAAAVIEREEQTIRRDPFFDFLSILLPISIHG